MKLIAKQGTAFEQTVRKMYDKITSSIVSARDFVELNTGVRPLDISCIYGWGIISRIRPEFVFDKKDKERINPEYLRRVTGTNNWVPALRYTKGRGFNSAFEELADKYEVREDPLNEYGIHQIDKECRCTYLIYPTYDSYTNRYVLRCSDSVPNAFDKKKLAKDQFDIYY